MGSSHLITARRPASGIATVASPIVRSPSNVVAKLRFDASVQGAGYGFSGDPDSPIGDRYYGYLIAARGY